MFPNITNKLKISTDNPKYLGIKQHLNNPQIKEKIQRKMECILTK